MMDRHQALKAYIKKHPVGKVVDFDPAKDRLLPLDFTAANAELTAEILTDTDRFTDWINAKLKADNARYGIGGYNEHRTIYSRSQHFSSPTGDEPRRLHLGVDIWGDAGTPVYNFADGVVYGLANNNNFGDYGATIIIKYELDRSVFFGLYGHLSTASINNLQVGQHIPAGVKFAEFGKKEENGFWPPHLHFQLMFDMEGNTTDYPGVCKFSERDRYLANCPDPMVILEQSLTSPLSRTLKLFALLDLVSLGFLSMQLWAIFQGDLTFTNTAKTIRLIGMPAIFILLLISAWGLFFSKKAGFIAYYLQFPLRLVLWVFSVGFITLLPEAFNYFGDLWFDWLFRICVVAEFFRLYATIRFHQKLRRL